MIKMIEIKGPNSITELHPDTIQETIDSLKEWGAVYRWFDDMYYGDYYPIPTSDLEYRDWYHLTGYTEAELELISEHFEEGKV